MIHLPDILSTNIKFSFRKTVQSAKEYLVSYAVVVGNVINLSQPELPRWIVGKIDKRSKENKKVWLAHDAF